MESIKSTIAEYEEAVEELADVRCQYGCKIEKYFSKMTDAEIEQIKNMKYKTQCSVIPEMKIDFSTSDKLSTDNEDQGLFEKNNECDSLKQEIMELKKIIQRISPNRMT